MPLSNDNGPLMVLCLVVLLSVRWTKVHYACFVDLCLSSAWYQLSFCCTAALLPLLLLLLLLQE
jgi:hypothetical protein